jgi:hypothetical protein
MAAGQGFKTFTTGEVLTAGDVNGYLMQGVLVFASTAARDAAITSPQEGQFAFTKDTNSLFYYDGAAWVASGATGDIEGVTAGIGISGGGTSGTVTVTNSMATAIDAKGDLVAGTGADTFAKLTVGANGTILTADSAEATGLKWAAAASGGGMTLLSTTTLSGATTTISSISQSYKNLFILLINAYGNTSSSMKLVLNGNNTAADYRMDMVLVNGATVQTNSGAQNDIGNVDNTSAWNNMTFATIQIPRYTETENKLITSTLRCLSNRLYTGTLLFNSTTAITSIGFNNASGTFSGGTVYVYGVN